MTIDVKQTSSIIDSVYKLFLDESQIFSAIWFCKTIDEESR